MIYRRLVECQSWACPSKGRRWVVDAERSQPGLIRWPDVLCEDCMCAPSTVSGSYFHNESMYDFT